MKIEEVIKQLESILDHTRSMAASPDADEIWKEDSDALEFAITALRSMQEDGEPLSLEQLKQMNGKPVWGKSLINEKPGEWFILRVVNMSKTWFIACAGAEQGFGDKDTYGKTWLAYSYPPAHIDRSKWISVKDRLPNEEDDVLILVREIEHYGRHHEKKEVYYWQFVGWRVDEKWATTYCHGFRHIDDENEKEPRCEHEVTHWMPLPEPPEEG